MEVDIGVKQKKHLPTQEIPRGLPFARFAPACSMRCDMFTSGLAIRPPPPQETITKT